MNATSIELEPRAKHTRRLDGFVSRHEKGLLEILARKLPASATPDQLTVIGFGGAVMVAVGLVLTHFAPVSGSLVALVGLLVNWFGDSLDGTLARVRNIERPRYGFFVDHMTDLAAQFLIVLGLGMSPAMRLDIAALALIGYLALSVYTLIKLHVSRSMQLSYFGVGPTEIRLVIAAGIIAGVCFNLPSFASPIGRLSVFDVIALIVSAFAIASACGLFEAAGVFVFGPSSDPLEAVVRRRARPVPPP